MSCGKQRETGFEEGERVDREGVGQCDLRPLAEVLRARACGLSATKISNEMLIPYVLHSFALSYCRSVSFSLFVCMCAC